MYRLALTSSRRLIRSSTHFRAILPYLTGPLIGTRRITIQAPSPSNDPDRRGNGGSEISYPPVVARSAAEADTGSGPQADETASATAGLANATSLPAPPEGSSAFTPRHLQHPFDTHAFVSYLEKNEISRNSARALMEAVRELIIKRGTRTGKDMVGKEDAENAAYLFNAALSELRTELSVQARNDGLALKAMAGAIRREVEGLEQKLKEDVQVLKHDIEMDMNNRKAETRTEMKGFDIYIEEINNKFTISLGDLRTEIESVKWDATRRAISIIILIVVATIAVSTFLATDAEPKTPPQTKITPPAMKDMGVGTDDEFMEEDLKSYTEERLDKLLSDSGVANLERKKSKSREHSREDKKKLAVDRI
uniref:Mitochondrial protein n=1 Tax=Kwoniella dejecticola CBS 10117 TaxID=1296121 RepID=A0A1A5ZXC4_9TREE|nr:mitochondrial protein [Kwoniella dejecticola CBS 10117]OBR82453.1 mitochondrial protein [Kwoniella dejecticola CBS 10117]